MDHHPAVQYSTAILALVCMSTADATFSEYVVVRSVTGYSVFHLPLHFYPVRKLHALLLQLLRVRQMNVYAQSPT